MPEPSEHAEARRGIAAPGGRSGSWKKMARDLPERLLDTAESVRRSHEQVADAMDGTPCGC